MAEVAPRRELAYRLGDVEIDVGRATVSRNGQDLHLRKKAFDVLLLLIARRGEVVTKQELIEVCWANAAVTDDAIVQCLGDIRRVLEDDAQHPRYVLTVKKVGYRLVAEVTDVDAGLPDSSAAAPERRGHSPRCSWPRVPHS